MNGRSEEGGSAPRTVDEARDAVERSRQRISSTLDTLEDRIVEKKHELKDRADVLRPVRERIAARPFPAVAVAVGLGLLLGRLGGGSDSAELRHTRSGRLRGEALSPRDRSELRQWRRARRDRLRSMVRENGGDAGRQDDVVGSSLDTLKHTLMGALTTAITAAVASRVREFAAGRAGGDEHGEGNGGRRYR